MKGNKMANDVKTERRVSPFEVIAASVLGLLAVLCFIVQMSTFSAKTTTLETALFNTLQFILTIGFAWFSSRAITRNEFERSLKQFGISAYRRISDIEKMISRLQTETNDMIARLPQDDHNELRIISAIVADTNQVVKSSINDWVDVIGDELISIEKIRRLESEKIEIRTTQDICNNQAEDNKALKDIESQINELKANLPPILRVATEDEKNKDSEKSLLRVAEWLSGKHSEESGLLIRVVAGEHYSPSITVTDFPPNRQLYIEKVGDRGLDVMDDNGVIWGRVLNPLPIEYDNSAKALEKCYGKAKLSIEFMKILKTYESSGGNYFHYSVKVLDQPIERSLLRPKRVKKQTP